MQGNQQRGTGTASHWKLTLSYNGSGFHGWQVQPGLLTVQGTLAQALARITGVPVLPQGSGRTDAGVHALAQVASFTLPVTLPPANLQRALNHLLPVSLRVLAAEILPPGFHARHSARRKHYEYRIFERRPPGSLTERICSPFLAPFAWDCPWPLDIARLQQAAALLLGTQDFTAMASARRELAQRPGQRTDGSHGVSSPAGSTPAAPNPVKTIYSAAWIKAETHTGPHAEALLLFNICGSGFLHHMVRNLVGTMVEIGRGALDVEDLPAILRSRNRSNAGPTAPACGLYLRAVEYDASDASENTGDPQASQADLADLGVGASR